MTTPEPANQPDAPVPGAAAAASAAGQPEPCWLEGLALLLACLLLYGPLLTALPWGVDHTLFHAPMFAQRWDWSRGLAGLPLWGDYMLSGAPLVENMQSALLYPPRWLFLFLPDWRMGYGAFYFAHYLLGMFGMAQLLRAWGVRGGALTCGVVVAMAGGHLQGRLLNPTTLMACCWLPWLFFGASGWRVRHGWITFFSVWMLGAIGSPHALFYGAIGYVIVVLAGWQTSESGRWRRLGCRMLYAAGGLCVAAPTLFTGLRRAGESLRTQTTTAGNLADSLGWFDTLTTVLGGSGGSIYPEYMDRCVYVGAPALLLCLLALCGRRAWSQPAVRAGVGLTLTGLCFAWGRHVGWQYVQPWIPGFDQLVGPYRALMLTAIGFGLLIGWGAQRFQRAGWGVPAFWLLCGSVLTALFSLKAWGKTPGQGSAPFLDDWLRVWLRGPGSLEALDFVILNAGAWLLVCGAVWLALGLLPGRARGWRGWALAVLTLMQMLHFAPRVKTPLVAPRDYAPGPQIQRLMALRAESRAPFRIAGYDPLRYSDYQLDQPHALDVLTPNAAGLYGLEDLQGFDPLINLEYARLVERLAGRAPFNDPLRNLDFDHPDPRLLRALNTRYLIGHPFERRVSHLPLEIDAQQTTASLDPPAQQALVRDRPLTHWRFVAHYRGPRRPPGDLLAELELAGDGERQRIPVRLGIETLPFEAQHAPAWFDLPGLRAGIFMSWSAHVTEAQINYRLKIADYACTLELPRPMRIRDLTWRWMGGPGALKIFSQACRYEPLPEEARQWRMVAGDAADLTPLYEFLDATGRATLLPPEVAPDANGAREKSGPAGIRDIQLDDASLTAKDASGTLTWEAYNPGQMRLRVESSRPAWLLVRESWSPGWRGRINGREAETARVNHVMLAVPLAAGKNQVDLQYAPRSVLRWALLAGGVLLAAGITGFGQWRRQRSAGDVAKAPQVVAGTAP